MGVDNALSRRTTERQGLGWAPGRANTGDKMMTLAASALASGDCIDDADALRTGGTARTLGGTVKAPSTPPLSRGQALGTFLRSFRWGHVRQLDRVSRELLARAWKAGAGPGDGPLTIDLDSTICETSYVGVGSPHRDGRPPTAGRGVQLLQPLAVQHVGLATRHVLDAFGVHQHHLEVPLFQHPEQGYPVHAGGLHDHGLHTALGQPVRQTVQVRREGLELSNRLCGTVGEYRHEMAVGPHVDARRVQICLGKLRGQTLPPPSREKGLLKHLLMPFVPTLQSS